MNRADFGKELGAPILLAERISKRYGSGEAAVWALKEVSLSVAAGEFVAIMGPSGSGKTTLLNCLACLDRIDKGELFVAGRPVSSLSDSDLARLRRRFGFVFQSFNLLPTLTARENVLLPLELAGAPVDRAWFDELVEFLGIRERLGHRPNELSGGQQQRVAIARALITRPLVVFADEPTGNLDTASRNEIMKIFKQGVEELNQTVVMVTHDPACAAYADRIVRLVDGEIVA